MLFQFYKEDVALRRLLCVQNTLLNSKNHLLPNMSFSWIFYANRPTEEIGGHHSFIIGKYSADLNKSYRYAFRSPVPIRPDNTPLSWTADSVYHSQIFYLGID